MKCAGVERFMDIADWRRRIDELDHQLVALINQRAQCAVEIGRLKRDLNMPVYEPDRERVIFENIACNNAGPLSDIQLRQIFERLVDVMRQIQGEEMMPAEKRVTGDGTNELEPQD